MRNLFVFLSWCKGAYEVWKMVLYAVPAIIAITFGLDYFNVVGESQALYIIAGLLFILFVFGMIAQVIYYGSKRIHFVEVYSSRDELNRRRGNLEKELAKSKGNWLLWRTASKVSSENIWLTGNIEKLILMHPNALKLMKGKSKKELGKIKHDILFATEKAQNANIPVKWFNKDIEQTMIIGGLNDKWWRGWIRLEILNPYATKSYRPSIQFGRGSNEKLFNSQVAYYKNVWDNSIEP